MRVVDLIKSSNFYKKVPSFDTIQKQYYVSNATNARDYYATETLYYFLSMLTTPNVKNQNYKVVDPIESYNFDVKSIFI
jgi:hypothetical protein